MDIDDQELFNSATNDEPIEVTADEPVAEEPVNDGPNRDEQGRFAPKEPEPVAEAQPEPQGKEEAYVPSWRLREIREERQAEQRRFQESQAQWQRQIAELQARLPKDEPKQEDVFENPNGFLEQGVRKQVEPLKSEVQEIREYFSRTRAEDKHGPEKVQAAYEWVARGMNTRDPEVGAVYQRAMRSPDPYDVLVKAHQQREVYTTIGNDPNAWFEKELEKRMADPQFSAAQLQRIQSGVRSNPQAPNQIKLPPSVGKVPSSHTASDDVGDMSDGSLFAQAIR